MVLGFRPRSFPRKKSITKKLKAVVEILQKLLYFTVAAIPCPEKCGTVRIEIRLAKTLLGICRLG
jgi:hypothetical protein